MTPASSRITDLSQLPLLLTIDEVSAIYRLAKSTIRRNLQLRRFTPKPFSGPPYRWRRADVERDLVQGPTKPRRRARATSTS